MATATSSNSKAFDKSEAGDAAISTTALIGVHEVTHAAQDEHGTIANAAADGQLLIAGAQHIAHGMSPDQAERVTAAAETKAETQRVDKVEYEAYLNQETLELQAGKTKKGFITVNPDGSELPREEAVANIQAFTTGQPLPYGPSKGAVFGGIVDAGSGGTPGRNSPGDTTGRNSPGEDAAGRNSPGDESGRAQQPGPQQPGRRGRWAQQPRQPDLRTQQPR